MAMDISATSAKDESAPPAPSLPNFIHIGREPVQLTCPQCQQVFTIFLIIPHLS